MRRAALATTAAVCMAICVSSCKKQETESSSTPSTTESQGVITATADSDVATQGGSIPSGYVVQLDRSSATTNEIAYTPDGTGRWEVKTGPAHIIYALDDTAYAKYRVTTTIEQLAKPNHPEAYGIFIGGSALDDTLARKYTYFIVRGDGKYSVKVRDGGNTKTITDWTEHAAIPKESGAGKAVYGITIDVDGDKADVSVNGKPVTTISEKDGPLRGVTGVRVNHNLHVMVTPLAITR
jgi:hypothetical protein